MSYPADGEVVFLLCEDVRREEDGKFNLIGVTTSGRTRLKAGGNGNKEGSLRAIPKLCLFFTTRVGEGTYQINVRVRDPSGNTVGEEVKGEMHKAADKALNISLAISPFIVAEYGDYSVELSLDDRQYVRAFTLADGDEQAS